MALSESGRFPDVIMTAIISTIRRNQRKHQRLDVPVKTSKEAHEKLHKITVSI